MKQCDLVKIAVDVPRELYAPHPHLNRRLQEGDEIAVEGVLDEAVIGEWEGWFCYFYQREGYTRLAFLPQAFASGGTKSQECACPITVLMSQGCQCGVARKERKHG